MDGRSGLRHRRSSAVVEGEGDRRRRRGGPAPALRRAARTSSAIASSSPALAERSTWCAYATGEVGRERGRCAGMRAEPPSARHFFVDDRADDRVSETKAPWRLRRTDHIGFDKFVEYPEHRCGGRFAMAATNSGSNDSSATAAASSASRASLEISLSSSWIAAATTGPAPSLRLVALSRRPDDDRAGEQLGPVARGKNGFPPPSRSSVARVAPSRPVPSSACASSADNGVSLTALPKPRARRPGAPLPVASAPDARQTRRAAVRETAARGARPARQRPRRSNAHHGARVRPSDV